MQTGPARPLRGSIFVAVFQGLESPVRAVSRGVLGAAIRRHLAPVFDQLECPAPGVSGRVLGSPLGRHFSEVVHQVPVADARDAPLLLKANVVNGIGKGPGRPLTVYFSITF
jgi:hypothetical protein